MRQFISSIILVFVANSWSQKINADNPTYMFVDLDLIPQYIQPELSGFGELYFSSEPVPESAQLAELKFGKKLNVDHLDFWNDLQLFQLDTSQLSPNGYFSFYQNTNYLNLEYRNANSLDKEMTSIGAVTKEFLNKKPNFEEFVKLLIYTGVIGTYNHLNAEMITLKKTNKEDVFEIEFSAVWHYCTNDCYDPKYKFAIRVNKISGEVILLKK
ncbi:MAG: hypothetical protein R2799_02385 [Crocinitomicaceae bacterium]